MKRISLSSYELFTLFAAIAFVFALFLAYRTPAPKFDGAKWTCPASYDVYADESEARQGKPFVYCVN